MEGGDVEKTERAPSMDPEAIWPLLLDIRAAPGASPPSGMTDVTKAALTPARRRLVELMQEVDYGRIERLEVPDDVARAIMRNPPKKDWQYLKKSGRKRQYLERWGDLPGGVERIKSWFCSPVPREVTLASKGGRVEI